jgi:hypothetical protein
MQATATPATLDLVLAELQQIRAAIEKPQKVCAHTLAKLERQIRDIERRVRDQERHAFGDPKDE